MDFGEGDAQIRPGQKSQVGFISGIEHIHLFDEIENLEELIFHCEGDPWCDENGQVMNCVYPLERICHH